MANNKLKKFLILFPGLFTILWLAFFQVNGNGIQAIDLFLIVIAMVWLVYGTLKASDDDKK
ncbi:MAG: hypothetical protein RIR66_425 [Actinomycetota bacterium]|jgi:hypothetical protein